MSYTSRSTISSHWKTQISGSGTNKALNLTLIGVNIQYGMQSKRFQESGYLDSLMRVAI